jgi:hypothetical protein
MNAPSHHKQISLQNITMKKVIKYFLKFKILLLLLVMVDRGGTYRKSFLGGLQ